MKRKGFNKKGFTMIELITVIVIVAIISVMAGMGLVQIANAYLRKKKHRRGSTGADSSGQAVQRAFRP